LRYLPQPRQCAGVGIRTPPRLSPLRYRRETSLYTMAFNFIGMESIHAYSLPALGGRDRFHSAMMPPFAKPYTRPARKSPTVRPDAIFTIATRLPIPRPPHSSGSTGGDLRRDRTARSDRASTGRERPPTVDRHNGSAVFQSVSDSRKWPSVGCRPIGDGRHSPQLSVMKGSVLRMHSIANAVAYAPRICTAARPNATPDAGLQAELRPA
jgi:hypothetical protein